MKKGLSRFGSVVGLLAATALSSHFAMASFGGGDSGFKVFDAKELKAKVVHLEGQIAENFYKSLDVEVTQLKPWQNIGKQVLDKDGNLLIQCMTYEKAPTTCNIFVRN